MPLTQGRPSRPQPNILLVVFDQMSALALPDYGHPLVRTPHLSRLAARGTVFERAYCASPLCSPSRYALLTGLLPSRIGAYDNASELPSGVPTLMHHLRAAGYRTCLAGKMDFTGADQLHGYEERLTTDLSPSDFGWVPDWDHPDQVQPWFHTLQSVAEAGPCDYSLSLQYDEEATFKAVQWLHKAKASADPRPFLLTLSVMQPHDPYQALRRFWDLYDHDSIDMPVLPAVPAAMRDPVGRRMYAMYDRGEFPVGEIEIRRARHAYYAMVSYCDELLGRLLAALAALGLDRDTMVIVTSDHGDMLGERGLWYKMNFFDGAVRVPLVMQGPGIEAGRRIAEPVSHLDLLPTLLSLTGTAVDASAANLDGRDLSSGMTGGLPVRGEVLGEYMGEGYDRPVVMIRRGAQKFVYSRGELAQLYDLGEDPREEHNLALNPAEAAPLRNLTDEVEGRWDLEALRNAVIGSQRRRRLVHRALTSGRVAPWDYEPRSDPSHEYYRNYGNDGPDPDRSLRLPRIP
ncbi:choline-sulfatase [Hypericibacter adhaerens]|uniref:Choline-sulfatase n=1 Tax=Hypericibacter adhaerens TaxID=2602016 RepID=A0A5J6MZ68_9PROT|nr:choline-sulfatase [Hypericibacter adhaerens]QEX22819.1 choline-sulfatase [Hypericibacter adhaerens]